MVINRRPYETNFSGNPVVYGWQDEVAQNNPDILFEVRIYLQLAANGAEYKELTRVALTPVNGQASIDISTFLHANLKAPAPDLAAAFTESTTQTGLFCVDFRRISISGALDEAWDGSEFDYPRRVVMGGISTNMWRGNNYWINYYPAKLPFLTWQSPNRLAGLRERIYLTWYNNTKVGAVNIRYQVLVTYTDRTTEEVFKALPAVFNRVYYIGAGLNQLGIVAPAGKSIWYWSITVQDINVAANPVNISESFTFQLDNRHQDNDLVLHYRNSLGGLDSVSIRGEVERNITLTGNEAAVATRTDWAFQKELPAFDRSLPHVEAETFKVDIGYMGKEDQARMRDLFLNREMYRERYGRWWPLKMLTKQYRFNASSDKLFSTAFEFGYADGGNYFYTPDIDLGAGKNLTNTCQARLVDMISAINYEAVDTAVVTWNWNIVNPGDDLVKGIEWRVPGFIEDWHFSATPPNEVKTTHAVPGRYTVQMRAVCREGSPGTIHSETIDIPLSDGPPTPINSEIINHSGMPRRLGSLTRNGMDLYSGTMTLKTNFHCPSGVANFSLNISFATIGSATLTTESGVYPAVVTHQGAATTFTWNGINVTNGIIIKYPA